MKSKIVAILETRTGAHLAEMITRRGGVAMAAPALEEVPDIEPATVAALIERWRAKPFDLVIFQTGVGTAGLFAAADAAGCSATLLEFLAASRVVVRGPKPTAALGARRVRIDIRAQTPFTTETVLGRSVDRGSQSGVRAGATLWCCESQVDRCAACAGRRGGRHRYLSMGIAGGSGSPRAAARRFADRFGGRIGVHQRRADFIISSRWRATRVKTRHWHL